MCGASSDVVLDNVKRVLLKWTWDVYSLSNSELAGTIINTIKLLLIIKCGKT